MSGYTVTLLCWYVIAVTATAFYYGYGGFLAAAAFLGVGYYCGRYRAEHD